MKKQYFKILAFALIFTLGIGITSYAMTSGYSSFKELYASEDASDYSIETNDVGSDMTILALHGGGIQRGTSELVEALSEKGKYNTYLFEGLKAFGNARLFLKAIRFDEPKAVSLVQDSDYTCSIIGAAGDEEVTYIGGQNKLLAELIRVHLKMKGYNVKTRCIPDEIAGIMDSNIVNKNKLFKGSYKMGGVQIEVSKGLRDKFLSDDSALNDYTHAINDALSKGWPLLTEYLKNITRGYDEKIEQVLQKNAGTPRELIRNIKDVSR